MLDTFTQFLRAAEILTCTSVALSAIWHLTPAVHCQVKRSTQSCYIWLESYLKIVNITSVTSAMAMYQHQHT